MNSTLLLNFNAQPVSLIPMSSINWQDACKFIYTNHAIALHHYDDWVVHSQKFEYQIPSVMILINAVKVKRRLRCEDDVNTAPSSHFLFLRDNNTCAYCTKRFPTSQLTVDHVVPRKLKGKTTWLNCVTSCYACNTNKSDKLIVPKFKPFRPTYDHLVKMMMRQPIFIPHHSWTYYLSGWKEELINLVPPQRHAGYEKSFLTDKRIKLLEAAE